MSKQFLSLHNFQQVSIPVEEDVLLYQKKKQNGICIASTVHLI